MGKSIFDHRYVEIITKLRNQRIKLGLSQLEIANLIGKRQSYISKIETCERRIDIIEFFTLCSVLKLPIARIIPTEFKNLMRI